MARLPLVTLAVVGHLLHGSVSMGNVLDRAHYGRLEAMPTVLQIYL